MIATVPRAKTSAAGRGCTLVSTQVLFEPVSKSQSTSTPRTTMSRTTRVCRWPRPSAGCRASRLPSGSSASSTGDAAASPTSTPANSPGAPRMNSATYTRTYYVLATLAEYGELSQQQVCDRIEMDRSDMVRLIDDLEARGNVIRGRDPHDRRRYRLTLSHPSPIIDP